MRIHQLSVTYQPEQDRVLLRVGSTDGDEMRIWLTRRLLARMWPLLNRLQTEQLLQAEPAAPQIAPADEDLRRMLADFRKEEFLQRADFATPFQERERLPLGPTPLLVTDVDITPLPAGRLRLAFTERPAAGAEGAARSFQLELEGKLVQGLVHLLDQAVGHAQWRDPFLAAPAAGAEGEPAAGGQTRPRLLN